MNNKTRDRRDRHRPIATGGRPDAENFFPQMNQPVQNNNNRQKTVKPKQNTPNKAVRGLFGDGIMGDEFSNFVGDASHMVGTVFAVLMLFGLLVGGSTIDVLFGSFALGLVFQNGVPFSGFIVGADLIAGLVSIVTSGIQIYLLLTWGRYNGNLKSWQKITMWLLVLGDTLLDMTTPAYLMTGETALTLSLADKGLGFYIVLFVSGGACAISENVVVFLSTLRKNGGRK